MSSTFRIATWNLERPKQNGWTKNQRRLDKIREIHADVWVLTETHEVIDLKDSYASVPSAPIKNYHNPGENLTTIWSRWKVLNQLQTFDPNFAVCVEIDSPFGAMMIYGTVIPYANDKGISGTAKRWEEQRRSIQHHRADWLRIQKQFPNHWMCIAGDFNQSRDKSGWYEDKQSVDLMTAALQDLSMVCVTQEKFHGLSRSTVDHICLSQSLDSRKTVVKAWEGTTPAGEKVSDHNGVWVDLSCIEYSEH